MQLKNQSVSAKLFLITDIYIAFAMLEFSTGLSGSLLVLILFLQRQVHNGLTAR